MNKYSKVFIALYLFSIMIFLLHVLYVGSAVWGDARYYYSFLRSLVLDGNLDFSNEFYNFHIVSQATHTGFLANKFAIGPALLWVPFFVVAHMIVVGLTYTGISIAADGYSWPYQLLVGLGCVGYSITGLYFCFIGLKKFVSTHPALLSSLAIFLASNLLFYSAVDPINSHSVSFFASSLLFYLTIKAWDSKQVKARDVCLMGLTTGLIALIRNQDIIWAIVPVVLLIRSIGRSIVLATKYTLIYVVSLALVLIPQLLVWKVIFGQITSPYLLLGEKFYWLQPQVYKVLLSTNHGLFIYSPILVLSVWGLTLMKEKYRWLRFSAMLIFILQVWIVGSWHSWWAGESYGNRMFISLMPLFTYGLSFWLKRYYGPKTIYLFSGLIIVNFISIIVYLINQ